jgi:ATP-dependent Clp protease ATP-binding subunit ClpA
MAERFDKFTERARNVLRFSHEEAQRLGHNYIGTEHLLLGLVREGDGVAAKVLTNLGVELSTVRETVGFVVGRGDRMVMGEIGLTPRVKRVMELAVAEARELDHQYIGTEHLLLGLVREGEGVAAGVLMSLGVSLDRVRNGVIDVLSQPSPFVGPAARASAGPDGYSPAARRAFALAQGEASRLGHSYLGTGHLLLGLLAEGEGAAARALAALGVELEAARAELARATWPADEAQTPVGLTPRLERALAEAAAQAGRRGPGTIEVGHLLLGLVIEGHNAAVGVLAGLGLRQDAVLAAVGAEMGPSQ